MIDEEKKEIIDSVTGDTDAKNPLGRPTVMTTETINKLETAFALGCSDIEACFYADISRTALTDYQRGHPDFTDRKELLKSKPIMAARQSVVKGLKDDPDLALKFLERKVKGEFSLRVENTGKDGEPIQTNMSVSINVRPVKPANS